MRTLIYFFFVTASVLHAENSQMGQKTDIKLLKQIYTGDPAVFRAETFNGKKRNVLNVAPSAEQIETALVGQVARHGLPDVARTSQGDQEFEKQIVDYVWSRLTDSEEDKKFIRSLFPGTLKRIHELKVDQTRIDRLNQAIIGPTFINDVSKNAPTLELGNAVQNPGFQPETILPIFINDSNENTPTPHPELLD